MGSEERNWGKFVKDVLVDHINDNFIDDEGLEIEEEEKLVSKTFEVDEGSTRLYQRFIYAIIGGIVVEIPLDEILLLP